MNTVMLYLAVLWLAIRQRWYESVWNPWGLGSRRHYAAQHRVAQDYMRWWEENGDAMMRAAKGRDGTPPSDPKPPVQ